MPDVDALRRARDDARAVWQRVNDPLDHSVHDDPVAVRARFLDAQSAVDEAEGDAGGGS